MTDSLLDKTRRLNKVIQSSGSKPLSFSGLAGILSELLHSNVYIADREGRITGYALVDDKCFKDWLLDMEDRPRLTKKSNNQLIKLSETIANIGIGNGEIIDIPMEDRFGKFTILVPIICGEDRLGTLIAERLGERYMEDDLVLAEYGATISGLEIVKAKAQELEDEARETAAVQMAVRTLSYSELEAIEHILMELDGNEGLLVASKIADRVGITRSVIVNALRKLESAGVIESRSLGMKGTHIKVLNDRLIDELEKNK